MSRCLFCLKDFPDEQMTDEHAFLAALGGDLKFKNGSCKSCNNGFSNQFEQTIAKHFVHFRYLLLIPNRRGKVPECYIKVEADGEQLEAKLLPDGTAQLKPIVKKIEKDGVTEIVHQHATEKQVSELRKKAKEEGLHLIEERSPGQQVEVNISGDLKFIDSPELLRAVTKTSYTVLALRMGRNFATRDIFDAARNYIKMGSGNPKARLFLHEGYMQACQYGPHQHAVILAGTNNRRSIDAIVRLFGGLSYFVNLSDDYEGADFFNTLPYDAQRGKEDKLLYGHEQAELLQIEDVRTSKETVWNDRVSSGAWFLKFFGVALKAEIHE